MKKRLFAVLMLLAALLMVFPALAATTKEEWDASCNWVIAYDATLYSAAFQDAATATALYTFTPCGTIAAGAKVSIRSSHSGMREIYYWDNGQRSAWVEDAAVIWDGGPSRLAGNAAKASDTWMDFGLTLVKEDGSEFPVTLEVLGTAQCVVFDGESLITVNTADLRWDTVDPVEEHQRLAAIYAPKTGQATLRASASSSAKSLDQCKDGRLVVVLKVGSVYTRVLYEGKEGCVLTDALTFYGVAMEEDFAIATLSYEGRTDTSATISVYTSEAASRRIDQWRVGNEVAVLEKGDSWSEIEIDGWHGFVKTEYLQ